MIEVTERESALLVAEKLLADDVARRVETAAGFNVFEQAGVAYNELAHSALIACLLAPDGAHRQGAKFLDSFLKRFIDKDLSSPNLAYTTVSTEYTLESGRRLDIRIDIPDEAPIGLENKIFAGEGAGQIPAYQSTLSSSGTLFFLTPDGRQPSEVISEGAEIKCISYLEIAEWLEIEISALPQKANSLRQPLKQYAALCRTIGGEAMNTLDCRTLDALRSSKHLKTLLQLEPYIGHLRREIAGAFWSRVGEYLCQSISNDAITWTLTVDDQITGKDVGIRIHPDNRKADKAYSIVLLGVAWPGKQPSYIGIHRPIEGRGYRQNPDAEIELRGLLESMDYDFRGDWAVGWIDLPRLGLGNVAGGAEQTVLRLELDNQSPNDHPLAKKTAEQLAKHLKDVWRPLGRLNGSS